MSDCGAAGCSLAGWGTVYAAGEAVLAVAHFDVGDAHVVELVVLVEAGVVPWVRGMVLLS